MDDTHEMNNVAETMRDVMVDLGKHEPLDETAERDVFSGATLITLPNGRKIEDLTNNHRAAAEFLKPARRKGTATLYDLQSMIDWANRFKGDNSIFYAKPDMRAPKLTCIADYHLQGPADAHNPEGDPLARHGHHRAEYNFPLSDEWKAWMAISGKAQDKDDLGEFIEANAKDIMDPTPAVLNLSEMTDNAAWENRLIQTALQIEGRYGQLSQLLAMSRQFQVYETSDLTVTSNRDTGEASIQFLNEHKGADKKPLSIPNLIIIAIPVFLNGAPYRMPVRFRYRKTGGSVKFILTPYNPEKAFEASFNEALDIAKTQTDLPLLKGSPETTTQR